MENNLQLSDSGQPLPPTFTDEAEAYLTAKGCVSLYDVTGIHNYKNWPIFLINNTETRNEVIQRLSPKAKRLYPHWVPCNNVFHMTEQESLKYLIPEISRRYKVNTLTNKCCDCVAGEECHGDDFSCSCSRTFNECFHPWRCRNSMTRDGIFPATYLAHTGSKVLGLGVKAGQEITIGTTIIPFVGRISCNDNEDDYSIDLMGQNLVQPDFDTLHISPVPYGGHGQFINSCGEGQEPNCVFQIDKVGNSIVAVIVADKNILDNEWLTLDYGDEYWTTREKKPIKQPARKVHQNVPVEIPMPSSDSLTWTRPVGRDNGLVVPPVELSLPPFPNGDFEAIKRAKNVPTSKKTKRKLY